MQLRLTSSNTVGTVCSNKMLCTVSLEDFGKCMGDQIA